MKLLQNAVIGVLLLTSVAVKAQTSNDTTKSEAKKREYKSKEWKQGDERITDTMSGATHKSTLKMQKKSRKLHGAPPPALPPADPSKP